MKKLNKKSGLWLAAIFLVGFSSFKMVEDYFEVSKNLDIFSRVYKEVHTSYVDEVKSGELIKTAINSMLSSLDPYTNFYSEAQAEDYRFQVTGAYGGIGASVISKEGKVVIDQPYEGFPAQQADLRCGDIIVAVDGQSVDGKSIGDLNKLLRGTAGTPITLTVDRPGIGELKKTFERAQIKLKNVPYFGMINESVGYIQLTGFTPNAGKEVREATLELKKQGAKNLILDLRNNGGGLLHEAVNIVNVFVKKGEKIVFTKGKEKETDQSYATLNAPVDTEIPLVILVNSRSASASEIVSGALQDLDRAVVVGRKSFGKGLVQSTRSLSYGTQMKITTAKYYIPSGRCIQKLDYIHKKDGKAIIVPDSAKSVFYTVNGREVKDGEGITPDVVVEDKDLKNITQSLITKFYLFDFATDYRNKNESIVEAREFDIDDKTYNDFVNYLNERDFHFATQTEDAIETLKVKAESEKYGNELLSEIDALELALKNSKKEDINKYKKEIKEELETEIARRYYFQKAEIESTFDSDEDIAQTLALFANLSEYNKMLSGE